MSNYRYGMIGRYVDGTSVVAYELADRKTGQNIKVTREQAAYLIGRGLIEGVSARLYREELIIEAVEGYTRVADLPKLDVKTGSLKFKNGAPQGTRRINISFDTATLIGRTDSGKFVIQTGTGSKIVDRMTLMKLLDAKKIINANAQTYTKDGKTQYIVRMADKSPLKSLPVYTEAQVTGQA